MPLQRCGLNLNRDRRELKPHGTLDFPCAVYSSEHAEFLYDEFPWHWHEEMEFIHLTEGKLKLQVPGKILYVQKGESIFINSRILHCGIAEDSCEKLSVVFHPELMGGDASIFAQKYINPIVQLQTLDCCLFHSEPQWMSEISRYLLNVFDAMTGEGIGYEFIVRENLSKVCLALYRQYVSEMAENHVKPDQDKLRIRKMLEFIHEHFADNIALSHIASSANIGERECLRCFKRVIQISPMQYLLKYRITQSASMLLNGDADSITGIARLCGFDNPSYFTLIFKRFFKCTPREYKKSSLQRGGFLYTKEGNI